MWPNKLVSVTRDSLSFANKTVKMGKGAARVVTNYHRADKGCTAWASVCVAWDKKYRQTRQNVLWPVLHP